MADNISPWDSAFPSECTQEHGLSKREYFAAMALQGLMQGQIEVKYAARLAVQAADALIDRLNQEAHLDRVLEVRNDADFG